MDPSYVIQGLTIGSIYALVGVSINIVYRPTNTFNVAQGNLVMVGAVLCATLLAKFGVAWYLAAGISLAVIALVSWVIHWQAVAPVLRQRGGGAHGWIVSTLAASMIIEDIVGKLVGPDPRPLPAPPLLSTASMLKNGVLVSSYQVALIILVLILVIAAEQFYRTRTGKAILAIAEDRDASLLRGIDPGRLAAVSFALSGLVAAAAGVLAGPIVFASVSIGAVMLIKGFEAAALGGIGNNYGSVVGGYMLGMVEVFASAALSPGYQDAASLAMFLLVLLIRPQGLFGRQVLRTV
ncbi:MULTISPECIES: branched-chain amino acid ABC transporter permease [unclassified Variovorax]|uniref:branched-chain amino acid ABC transporter permease n=1 Tax=unclassified Variovorax TaxID=663243 RepID=UPI001317D96C|nr:MULTISPECIES: branched-chain amino acid ABC transporter permease [unclassified Variovorax]VTU33734.1 LIV-I protein H [Variovorax sp. SRS16]VTU39999.1 LIV-I protein H [Variovorax sp. PBL-E5]